MNDKPQAFPSDYFADSGMTLRDYMAAKAMQGLLAADTGFTMYSAKIAELAYEQADAMLKARKS